MNNQNYKILIPDFEDICTHTRWCKAACTELEYVIQMAEGWYNKMYHYKQNIGNADIMQAPYKIEVKWGPNRVLGKT